MACNAQIDFLVMKHEQKIPIRNSFSAQPKSRKKNNFELDQVINLKKAIFKEFQDKKKMEEDEKNPSLQSNKCINNFTINDNVDQDPLQQKKIDQERFMHKLLQQMQNYEVQKSKTLVPANRNKDIIIKPKIEKYQNYLAKKTVCMDDIYKNQSVQDEIKNIALEKITYQESLKKRELWKDYYQSKPMSDKEKKQLQLKEKQKEQIYHGLLSPQEEELKQIIQQQLNIEEINYLKRLYLTKNLKQLSIENQKINPAIIQIDMPPNYKGNRKNIVFTPFGVKVRRKLTVDQNVVNNYGKKKSERQFARLYQKNQKNEKQKIQIQKKKKQSNLQKVKEIQSELRTEQRVHCINDEYRQEIKKLLETNHIDIAKVIGLELNLKDYNIKENQEDILQKNEIQARQILSKKANKDIKSKFSQFLTATSSPVVKKNPELNQFYKDKIEQEIKNVHVRSRVTTQNSQDSIRSQSVSRTSSPQKKNKLKLFLEKGQKSSSPSQSPLKQSPKLSSFSVKKQENSKLFFNFATDSSPTGSNNNKSLYSSKFGRKFSIGKQQFMKQSSTRPGSSPKNGMSKISLFGLQSSTQQSQDEEDGEIQDEIQEFKLKQDYQNKLDDKLNELYNSDDSDNKYIEKQDEQQIQQDKQETLISQDYNNTVEDEKDQQQIQQEEKEVKEMKKKRKKTIKKKTINITESNDEDLSQFHVQSIIDKYEKEKELGKLNRIPTSQNLGSENFQRKSHKRTTTGIVLPKNPYEIDKNFNIKQQRKESNKFENSRRFTRNISALSNLSKKESVKSTESLDKFKSFQGRQSIAPQKSTLILEPKKSIFIDAPSQRIFGSILGNNPQQQSIQKSKTSMIIQAEKNPIQIKNSIFSKQQKQQQQDIQPQQNNKQQENQEQKQQLQGIMKKCSFMKNLRTQVNLKLSKNDEENDKNMNEQEIQRNQERKNSNFRSQQLLDKNALQIPQENLGQEDDENSMPITPMSNRQKIQPRKFINTDNIKNKNLEDLKDLYSTFINKVVKEQKQSHKQKKKLWKQTNRLERRTENVFDRSQKKVGKNLDNNDNSSKYYYKKKEEFNIQKELQFEKKFKDSVQADRQILSGDFKNYMEIKEFQSDIVNTLVYNISEKEKQFLLHQSMILNQEQQQQIQQQQNQKNQLHDQKQYQQQTKPINININKQSGKMEAVNSNISHLKIIKDYYTEQRQLENF